MKSPAPSRWRRALRLLARLCGLVILTGLGVAGYANLAPGWKSDGRLFDDAKSVPSTRVGLVFGTNARFQGRENLYFRYRMDAAADLWKAGKIKCLIISGDGRAKDYNEPGEMRQALVARGVPDNRIVADEMGLSTLDSVARAKEVFGVTNIVFISQRFQNERAIYMANAYGIDAKGFNAKDISGSGGDRIRVREMGARVKMWWDLNVYRTHPKLPADKIALPPDH